MGPLIPEWDLASWLAGGTPISPPDWTAAALLRRAPAGDGWQIYLECRTPTNPDPAASDVVRVRWGMKPDEVIDVTRPASEQAAPGRWSAVVPLSARQRPKLEARDGSSAHDVGQCGAFAFKAVLTQHVADAVGLQRVERRAADGGFRLPEHDPCVARGRGRDENGK